MEEKTVAHYIVLIDEKDMYCIYKIYDDGTSEKLSAAEFPMTEEGLQMATTLCKDLNKLL